MTFEPTWFRFQPGPEPSRAAFPNEPVFRPLLDVVLEGPAGSLTTSLLVDSGSEYTLVSHAFARRIGVDTSLSDDYAEAVRIGGQTLPALLGYAMLQVPAFGPVGETLIGFVRGWNFAHAGVLGQRGFFERVGVMFDRPNLRFGLVKTEELDEAFPASSPPGPLGPTRMEQLEGRSRRGKPLR